MATLPESAIFEEGIFQLEKSTPPLGGTPVFSGSTPTAGHANAQAAQLANRTSFLNLNKVDIARLSLEGLADKIPFGDSDGKLDISWISDLIARQAAVNALAADVEALKTNSVNVKDYGAKGDGTTNDLSVVQALINSVSSTGGGAVYFPRGNYLITGLTVPGNVFLVGAGASATFLSYQGEAGLVGIDYTYKSTSYNVGGYSGLTPYNIGSVAAAAVRTPASTDAFSKSQRYSFTDFAIRGVSGNNVGIILGDSATAAIQRFFIQGPYVAQNADSGQLQDTGIQMKGVRGIVNADISSYKIRGVRTAFQASDFTEGFSVYSGEVVGSWDGFIADSTPSKPGGFIYNNHFNCVHRGIKLDRRRHITIGTNQYYRDASFYPSGVGYRAIEINNSGNITIGTVQTRIGVGFTDEGVGVSITDSPDVVIENITGGETGTLTKAISVTATTTGSCPGVTLKGISADALPVWAELIGPVSRFKLSDNINERGSASTTPIIMTGAVDKASIKLPKASTAIAEYQLFPNRSAALSKDIKFRAHPADFKESLVAGSGSYAVNYYFDTASAVNGDTFTMRLTQIGGSNSTLNLYSGASTSSPALLLTLAAAAAGVNQFRVFTIKFNGTAWEIFNNSSSLT